MERGAWGTRDIKNVATDENGFEDVEDTDEHDHKSKQEQNSVSLWYPQAASCLVFVHLAGQCSDGLFILLFGKFGYPHLWRDRGLLPYHYSLAHRALTEQVFSQRCG